MVFVLGIDTDFFVVVFNSSRSPYGAILCKPPRLRTNVLTLTAAVRHSWSNVLQGNIARKHQETTLRLPGK